MAFIVKKVDEFKHPVKLVGVGENSELVEFTVTMRFKKLTSDTLEKLKSTFTQPVNPGESVPERDADYLLNNLLVGWDDGEVVWPDGNDKFSRQALIDLLQEFPGSNFKIFNQFAVASYGNIEIKN